MVPNVTSYVLYNNDSPTFQANGAGSEIVLPGVTGISGLNNWLYINARSGGEVDLYPLASITNSYINISSNGTGADNDASTIDLSALATFTESGGPYGDLSATNGGDAIVPLLTAPIRLNITIGPTNGGSTPSVLATSQLTSFLAGSISLYQDADLSGLTDIDGTSLYASNGVTLTVPNVTSYAEYNNDSPTFQAYGAGSTIELPGVTSLSGLDNWLYINAPPEEKWTSLP